MSTSVSATVTVSVSMQGAQFSSAEVVVTGENSPIVELPLAASETSDPITGLVFDKDLCALLYFLSDTNDVKITFTNASTPIEKTILAGKPWVLYDQAAIAAFLQRDVTGVTIQNLDEYTNADGSTTANVAATDVHGRLVLIAP